MQSLSGKVALVTGATGGIGRVTAIALAAAGAKVVAAGRRDAEGEETVRLVNDAGGEAHFVRADVSRDEDVERLIGVALDRFGGLHGAVNNAGIDLNAGVIDATEEQFNELVSINLKGVWLCMRHDLRHMRKAGSGAIVNVNSVSGARPTDAQAIYGMTKRGVTHLTQSAAREAGKDGVRVNEILLAS